MENTRILRDGDLRARILAPENSRYNRTRFNHSAFIPDFWLGGTRFSQYERNQNDGFPTTEGSGLCCEYACDDMLKAAPVGEWVLKPGIGQIQRREQDWSIVHLIPYRPLDTKWEAGDSWAVYQTVSPVVRGFGYSEKREVRLKEDTITLETVLKNTGDNPLVMREYCHNFLSIGDNEIGPDYRMDIPAMVSPASLNSSPLAYALTGDENGFSFSGEVLKSFYVKTEELRPSEYTWRMYRKQGTAFIQETDSFQPVCIAVWGDYYVFSCEVFIPIDLKPGEEMRWTRAWKMSE